MPSQPKKDFRTIKKRGLSVAVISFGVIVLMLLCYVQQPRFLRMLDYKIYDAMLYAGADGKVTPYPIIIDLDEASLEAYGQWPWPRYLMADLLTRLRNAGVAAVGVDMLLSEEDRTSPRTLREDLARHLGLDISFAGLPEELYDFDRLLARSLDRGVILGMSCNFVQPDAGKRSPDNQDQLGATEKTQETKAAGTLPAVPPSVGSVVRGAPGARELEYYAPTADQATLPLPQFWDVAPVGMINMNPDLDGVSRRLPLIGFYGKKMYVTLALRTLMAGLGIDSVTANMGKDGLVSLRVGPLTIPVSPDGSFTLPFRGGARTFPYYSVKDIMEGRIPAEQLQGKLAFLGTSATGLLDIRISPLARVYPGVEIHATAVDAILAGTFLRVPPGTPAMQAFAIIVCGIVSAFAFGFSRPRVYVLVAISLLGAAFGASVYCFRQGYVISPLYVVLTMALLGAILLVLRFWQEEKQKNMLRSAFSRYVAPEVVERITRLEGNIFAGEERELSIMFTDIRGFTSISEKLSPQQIVQLLNRYFTPMTALVRGNKGTLDKFIGDALMAFWNAPVEVPGHPGLAVKTALEMQEKLGVINESLREEFDVTIAMGVGVHTGKAYVGNMGSEELLNYTLIGDSVNLASRLEGLCPQFGVGIVVSSETKNACDDSIAFLPLDTLRVKGKRQPVSVFAAMRPEERAARDEELSAYLDAYALYSRGDFIPACGAFGALAEKYPNAKLYALYQGRCEALRDTPPSDWDGVWTLQSK